MLNNFVVYGFLAIRLVDVWLGFFFYSFLGILLVGGSVVVIAACQVVLVITFEV